MIEDLTKSIPPELKSTAKQYGDELFFPHLEVIRVIEVATQHGIAILGVEFFGLRSDGLRTINYSAYDLQFTGDWRAFVKANNDEALHFVEANILGGNHGYILTSTSQNEFSNLRVP